MKTSETTAELTKALVTLERVIHNPPKTTTAKVKTKTGRDYSYTYATLPDILDQVRPVLHANGLTIVMDAIAEDGSVGVAARLAHISGEWMEFGPLMLPAGPDAQSAGSAITYARRYLLCAALGIAADEDDDGAKASRETWGDTVAAPKPAPPAPARSTLSPGTEGGAERPEPEGDGEGPEGSGERPEGSRASSIDRGRAPDASSSGDRVSSPGAAPSGESSDTTARDVEEAGEAAPAVAPSPPPDTAAAEIRALLAKALGSEAKVRNLLNKANGTGFTKSNEAEASVEQWQAALAEYESHAA